MIAVNEQACPQNHACPAVRSCPVGAIIQQDIFSAPRIDHELCTECGVCIQVCPVSVFTQVADAVGVR
jgi:Fe-S-cluster-containing hydrogenase component 2